MELSAITAIAFLLTAGYLCGRIARYLKLPALIGYLIAGVLLGPSLFDLFPETTLENLTFITNLSLGCIAFIIGSELKISSLRRMGTGIVILIITECLMAFLLVTAAVYLVSHNLALALLFGGLAPASARRVLSQSSRNTGPGASLPRLSMLWLVLTTVWRLLSSA